MKTLLPLTNVLLAPRNTPSAGKQHAEVAVQELWSNDLVTR
jgi:hypothetical protein